MPNNFSLFRSAALLGDYYASIPKQQLQRVLEEASIGVLSVSGDAREEKEVEDWAEGKLRSLDHCV